MMTISDSEIKLYVDAMVIESLLDDPLVIKNAGVGDGVGDGVKMVLEQIKNYIASKIDPNNKVESVLNLLAPMPIQTLFSALGAGKIGFLLALAQQVFNINVVGFLTSIYESVKQIITSGQKATPQQLDAVVNNSMSANYSPVTDADEARAINMIERNKSASYYDFQKQMRDVRSVKLAIIAFEEGVLHKEAGLWGGVSFELLQGNVIKVLVTLLGIVLKFAFGSAGFIVGGDLVREVVNPSGGGIFSAFTGSKPAPAVSAYVPTQTKFKLNPAYQNTKYNMGDNFWAENAVNNTNGISDMLVKFAKEVYDGLDGLESLMKSLATFQEVVYFIADLNKTAEGSNRVYLPKQLTSKKQIIDMFIDELAKEAP